MKKNKKGKGKGRKTRRRGKGKGGWEPHLMEHVGLRFAVVQKEVRTGREREIGDGMNEEVRAEIVREE